MLDPLSDIRQYGKSLTIAQVVKFFEKKALPITRPMIQNYIRDGLLPPPVNKRFYTHKHLAALVVIDHAKQVFDMRDIKTALEPLLACEGLPLEIYRTLMTALEGLLSEWRALLGTRLAETDAGLGLLLLMTHTADLKASALANREA